MGKFFVPRENISDNKLIINSEDVNHISKVLRFGIGDKITCCDGMGNDYEVQICTLDKREIICNILSSKKAETEAGLFVTLIQGIPKGSKMDYIIQKTTELGVKRIIPCEMNRCVAKIDGDKKIERWQKIAVEAAKQSGRGMVPEVTSPVSFTGALNILKEADICFAPYECEEESYLKPLLTSGAIPKTVTYIIGPEGGFDPTEVEKLANEKIPTVSLGKRILRTETAGEAVLSMVMYELGDING